MFRSLLTGLALAAAAAAPAHANLNIFACEPEWGALSHEIGGDKVSVYTATTGLQDPHHVEARPSLIAKARSADLAVCTGAELEIGWLPMIEQQTANDKIAPGAQGDFEASSALRSFSKYRRRSTAPPAISTLPVIRTSKPIRATFSLAAGPLAQRMGPARSRKRRVLHAALQRLRDTLPSRDRQMANGSCAAPWHADPRGTSELGVSRELARPRPRRSAGAEAGVPPSSGYLASILEKIQKQPVKFIMRAAYEDDRPSNFIAGRTNLPVVTLPFTVGGDEQAKDLFSLYDDTINRLLAGVKH